MQCSVALVSEEDFYIMPLNSDEVSSLSRTRWGSKYHIMFAP